jgi:hypothetical protein
MMIVYLSFIDNIVRHICVGSYVLHNSQLHRRVQGTICCAPLLSSIPLLWQIPIANLKLSSPTSSDSSANANAEATRGGECITSKCGNASGSWINIEAISPDKFMRVRWIVAMLPNRSNASRDMLSIQSVWRGFRRLFSASDPEVPDSPIGRFGVAFVPQPTIHTCCRDTSCDSSVGRYETSIPSHSIRRKVVTVESKCQLFLILAMSDQTSFDSSSFECMNGCRMESDRRFLICEWMRVHISFGSVSTVMSNASIADDPSSEDMMDFRNSAGALSFPSHWKMSRVPQEGVLKRFQAIEAGDSPVDRGSVPPMA